MNPEPTAATTASRPTTRYLLVPWTLDATTPGVVYAEVVDIPPIAIGKFEDHLLAADAVCAHNAVLSMRPSV